MAGTLVLSACLGGGEDTLEAPATTTTPPTSRLDRTTSTPLTTAATSRAPTTGATTSSPAEGAPPAIVAAEGLLGWWEGAWVSPSGPPPLSGGETYRIISLDGAGDAVRGAAPQPVGEPCPDDLYDVDLEPSPWAGYDPFSPHPLALSADWDPAPRPVERLSTRSTVYQEAMATLLAHRGVDTIEPQLVQALRTDLEGDGVDEVFLVAENIDGNFFAGAGSYSLAIARKLVEGEVQTAILGVSVVADGSREEFPVLVSHRIGAIADLDGDGDLEVAVGWAYYEGAGTSIYDYVDDDLGFVEVLAVGCGA